MPNYYRQTSDNLSVSPSRYNNLHILINSIKQKLSAHLRYVTSNNYFSLNFSGFRSLLHQLVQSQTETISLSRQRLEIEKRRFEYEQNVGDKLLAVLQTIANK